MKITRALVITGTCAVLTMSAVAGLAPAASAADGGSTTCSSADRTALRQEIVDLHTQIAALRLTPQQIADAKAAHQKAVADLRAEYGLPGATLTDAQRTELKAKIAALRADARQAAEDRRAKIDPLKAKILSDRSQLASCRAGGASSQS